jgi:lysozyme
MKHKGKISLILTIALLVSVVQGAKNSTFRKFIPEKFSSCEESKTSCFGIDISRYQTVNFNLLDSNISFVFCKATEGSKLIDRKFNYHWENIGSHLKKGAYHFFRPYANGKDQAKLFLSTVNFSSGHLAPVIDVEGERGYSKLNPRIYVANLKIMIREIEETLGVRPIIYTNTHFWNRYFSTHMKDMVREYRLWVADYRDREEPVIPHGWEDWAIWQHTCKGRIKGISHDVDLNVCKLNLDELVIP